MQDVTPVSGAEPTLPGAVLLGVAMFGASLGVAPEALEGALGRPLTDLADPALRVPYRHGLAVWRLLESRFPERALGLELARMLPTEAFGTVQFAARHAATVGESLEVWLRYHRVVSTHLGIHRDGHTVRFTHADVVFDVRSVLDLSLAFAVRSLRAMTGDEALVACVRVPHAGVGDPATYREVLGAEVQFGTADAAVVLREGALDVPMQAAQPMLSRTLQQHLDRALEDVRSRFPEPAGELVELREAVAELGERGTFGTQELAEHLGVPLRTLQRRASDHGTTLRELIDAHREAMSAELLEETALSVDDVAFLVGYAEERSFTRAFRRWKGVTPAAFRHSRA